MTAVKEGLVDMAEMLLNKALVLEIIAAFVNAQNSVGVTIT
jgi:hypothetical protein